MSKFLLISFIFFIIQIYYAESEVNKKKMVLPENNEKAEKECRLKEEYIPIEKDNIQNIAGTGLEVSGVKLRPEGCAWNPDRGWHKPKN
ncbi:MAG: hypothetical protein CFH26_00829 [Alphaproteobacteria bacterium MarineAlpha6_Bin4]|nr:MAG: hypothetical protein CFH26_00829 [Alphaproteobacteria bacterium MarineAlpha6_Bin4]|tara:strand:- start:17 stop:283 length:267 start_codon:yes stop_codon:yes gene_type:complete